MNEIYFVKELPIIYIGADNLSRAAMLLCAIVYVRNRLRKKNEWRTSSSFSQSEPLMNIKQQAISCGVAFIR